MYLQEADEKDKAMKKIFLLSLLVFVTACDEPTRQERFESIVVNSGTPSGATNIEFIDGKWYTFKWKGQCFLAMRFWRHAAATKIDCEDEVSILVLNENK